MTAACSSSESNSGAGGSPGQGGAASGGAANGGVTSSGGASAGGSASGGASSGGAASGGASSGGAASGGSSSGGSSNGGGSSGGSSGAASGGSSAGGKSGGGAAGSSGAAGANAGGNGGASSSGFTLTSPGWTSQPDCAPDKKTGCGVFPKENIGTNLGGSNKSPEFDWTAGPSGTQSYAIVMHDLTNLMNGKPFVHWVIWNIPGSTRMLPAGLETTAMPSVPAGASQKSFQGNGYQGSGKCGNVYEFVLYALTTATISPTATSQTTVADALDATKAPTTTLRARSGAPGCTE